MREDTEEKNGNSARHIPEYEANRINHAIERAIRDPDFINYAIGYLKDLSFPAFKHNIIEHVKRQKADQDVIALFESLDGYIEFRDQYHIRKALEENIPAKKHEYQITDESRTNPNVRMRSTAADKSIKDNEAVNETEERKDYPEVPPSAMKVYICNRCGKQFQNPDELTRHQEFESGHVMQK